MKTSIMKIYVAAAVVAASIAAASCGGTKDVVKASGEQKITVPCAGAAFRTDKDFFRGVGDATSKSLSTARDKARMIANTALSGSITTTMKSVAERYVNDAGQSPADYSETFESMTKQVINQQISNVGVACEETTQANDGMFHVYMAVEASKEEVFKALERSAGAEKKLETIFNREKFRKQFDDEMAQFAKSQGY
ncbi:MAG: hypothetical protein LBS63_00420 [Prevotellaceae bacterium]|jgi:hypothetical protein|nr:hypothetical protein [Prevotellaceae bacterium]